MPQIPGLVAQFPDSQLSSYQQNFSKELWFTNDVHKVNTPLGLKTPEVRHLLSQMRFYYFLPCALLQVI